MKSTGIKCVMREGGRIVIPSKLRSILAIKNKDILEIKTKHETVSLTKHEFANESIIEGYWYNPVDAKGRIVIPEDVRIELNIQDKDELLLYMEDEFLVLKKDE
ncbi:AbrB/MazE/SpoVT family DNA-binding domain-containing protein [Priestia megaterium]|uniref:AbrB/MazE/SpoVT family DNA-binding domain-containing protein n=1 Tax=Priestia megaterium TaxID=1404 RepID=UPI0012B92F51|nr:AbrB/MazE/SpoVT family DNA-binding domain-containing protein [Priestia megaterium]